MDLLDNFRHIFSLLLDVREFRGGRLGKLGFKQGYLEEQAVKKVVKLDSEIKKIRKAGLKTMKKLRSQVMPTVPANPHLPAISICSFLLTLHY